VRLPTWCPFRLKFYCNGHSYLARQMDKRKMEYRVWDKAFGWIADFDKAQKQADEFRVEMLHRKLDDFATRYCPVLKQFDLSYHGSLGDRVNGWRVCWIGGWDKCRVLFVVMVERPRRRRRTGRRISA
jgi:hypothetical protein